MISPPSDARRSRRAPSRRVAHVGRRDLPYAGAGGGRQRAARRILHPPDLAGEPLRPKAVSPMGAQGIAQFMPQTAAMRGLDQRLRAAAGVARVGELPARAAHDLPRQSRSGRGRLQCRSRRGRSLARRPRRSCRSRRRPMSASSPAMPRRRGRRSRRRSSSPRRGRRARAASSSPRS